MNLCLIQRKLSEKLFCKLFIFILTMFLTGLFAISKVEAGYYCDTGEDTIYCDDSDSTVSIGTTSVGAQLEITNDDSNSSTMKGINTRENDDEPAVYGKHDALFEEEGLKQGYGVGVIGEGGYYGVYGRVNATGSNYYYGVHGIAYGGSSTNKNYGVYGGASGSGTKYAVYGNVSGESGTKYAGYFDGNVYVWGTLSKSSGSFKIDHPLDPENKYLSHSFVESPDMMNIYNGNIVTDFNGEARVQLPDYFKVLNRDFRYQLSVIGQFGQATLKEKIRDNGFVIQSSGPNMEISWQVTGIRQDPWAEQNRIQVVEEKLEEDRGKYLNPVVYGHPEEMGIHYTPPDTNE